MARRVTWTNNSTGYDGTNIYRDTTIDPQNLPEPIATVGPVAQGATVEYIDLTGRGDQCYAVRDFDSSGDGALSEAYCFEPEPDYANAQVGDYIGGGVYAGKITYADASEYHLVFGLQSSETDLSWKQANSNTDGTNDEDDGIANTDSAVIASGDHAAAEYCDSYENEGYTDWGLPAINELASVDQLVQSSHPEFTDDPGAVRWSSTQRSDNTDQAWFRRGSDGIQNTSNKTDVRAVRPYRRIAV